MLWFCGVINWREKKRMSDIAWTLGDEVNDLYILLCAIKLGVGS